MVQDISLSSLNQLVMIMRVIDAFYLFKYRNKQQFVFAANVKWTLPNEIP
jgi:hypothetical protein